MLNSKLTLSVCLDGWCVFLDEEAGLQSDVLFVVNLALCIKKICPILDPPSSHVLIKIASFYVDI